MNAGFARFRSLCAIRFWSARRDWHVFIRAIFRGPLVIFERSAVFSVSGCTI